MELEDKWKAILTGAVITGLAPFIPFLNLACCVVPLVGALVAVAIYRGSVPPPALTNNDGIVLGTMTALIGTGIYAATVVPLVLFVGSVFGGILGHMVPTLSEIPESIRRLLEGIFSNAANIMGFILLIKIIGHLALSLIFGILGGLLGVALFRRSVPPRPQV